MHKQEFAYHVYGLRVQSAIPFPELIPSNGDPEVLIRLGEVSPPSEAQKISERLWIATGNEIYLKYLSGFLCVKDGREITVAPGKDISEIMVRLWILGPAFGILLHQRGSLVLHASAIAVDGFTVAFLGYSGGGKSTTAASLHFRGLPLVTDDITAIRMISQKAMVYPAYPQIKISPAAAAVLGDREENLIFLEQNLDKRGRRVPQDFRIDPLPLRRIYVLAEGDRPEIKPMSNQEALKELLRHTYCARFISANEQPGHFLKCGELIRSVSLRRLQRPMDLQLLPRVTEMLLEDISK